MTIPAPRWGYDDRMGVVFYQGRCPWLFSPAPFGAAYPIIPARRDRDCFGRWPLGADVVFLEQAAEPSLREFVRVPVASLTE